MTVAGTLMRYISWRFLVAITGVVLVCMVLIFFGDMIELLRQAGKYGSVPLLTLVWMALLRLPANAELTLPIAVLIGSIGGFLLLSRSSELTVLRASGMSAWQFILPGLVVAMAIGVLSVVAFNPIAAWTRAEAEELFADAFGQRSSLLKTKGAGAWLRQDGVDGPSVLHADIAANQGLSLAGVTVIQYAEGDHFYERIEAERAELKEGRWELHNAWVTWSGALEREPAFYEHYIVSTYLTPTQVRDSLGSVRSLSIWELPTFIETAEKAGLPAVRHKLQFQTLLSRPFLLAIMVLLAATCSLRAFRFGKIQTMVVTGLSAGFAFFVVAEISRNFGHAGLATPEVAAWAPAILACLVSVTVLLHQEDG